MKLDLNRCLFVDIEASGLHRNSYPIEIGWCDISGVGEALLIRPESSWTHWDPEAERLHGISRLAIERQGLPREQVAARFRAFSDGRVILVDSPEYDSRWLSMLVGEPVNAENSRELAATIAQHADASWPSIKLEAARLARITHRALDDARHSAALVRVAASKRGRRGRGG